MNKVLKRAAVARSDQTRSEPSHVTSVNVVGRWGRAAGCLHVLFVCFRLTGEAALPRRWRTPQHRKGGASTGGLTCIAVAPACAGAAHSVKQDTLMNRKPPALRILGYGLGEFPCECLTL